nr:intraflagellar transport protein 20 homolog [Rhipicephalus microplus]
MTEFQSVVDKYIAISDKLAAEVEHEKLKAIGSRNLLKSVVKDRETQQQQLQALVLEKKIELERLRIQLNALKREEAEQNELIEQFRCSHETTVLIEPECNAEIVIKVIHTSSVLFYQDTLARVPFC